MSRTDVVQFLRFSFPKQASIIFFVEIALAFCMKGLTFMSPA